MNKGLNFCPTQEKYNKNELIKDFENFARKIRLKAYFGPDLTENTKKGYKTKNKSTWEPSFTHHTVKTFIDAVRKDI